MKKILLIAIAGFMCAACSSKSSPQAQPEKKVDNTMTQYVEQLQSNTAKARENAALANQKIQEHQDIYQENKTESN